VKPFTLKSVLGLVFGIHAVLKQAKLANKLMINWHFGFINTFVFKNQIPQEYDQNGL